MSAWFIVAALFGQIPETPKLHESLGKLPEVHSAELVVAPPSAKITLIHLRDWHYVPFEDFVTDLDEGATEQEQRQAFGRFLKSVDLVQRDQRMILKRLAELGIANVHLEGLTADEERIFPLLCRTLWKGDEQAQFDFDKFTSGPNALSIRAPGQLLAGGELKRVRAADSDQALIECNPFDASGSRREVTAAAKERREDYMVSRMLETGTSVIVLGGAHDLSDNIKRLAADKAQLVVITPKAYNAASEFDK